MLSLHLYSCAFIILLALSYVAIKASAREILLVKFGLRRRRATSSLTPPRSFSPEKQSGPSGKQPTALEYKDAFPPSRRHTLTALPVDGLDCNGEPASTLASKPADYSKCLPDKKSPAISEHANHITATGFTLEEIERLGNFPDYATLSGVRLPVQYHGFDINAAIPRPYRPIRWAYHQTMSLTRMESDWWLELDSSYVERIQQRMDLFEKHGPDVLQVLPGAELAAKELMEMCLQFLCARYPQYFCLDIPNNVFFNGILKSTTDLHATPPMHVLLQNVPEDFALMIRDPETGLYSFRAGMICSSLGWNLGTKIGLKLHEIHDPIPDYKEKMQFSMDRYFAKKPTDKPIQRGSWGLEIDEPLFMPPGDPHEKLRDAQNPEHTISRCRLRVDWQTLRRLPLSGAVLFNFKGLFTPVEEFRDEPYVPTLVLKVLRDGKRTLMEYKNTWHTEHVVIPVLEEYEREQIEKGLMVEGWEPHTLDESPFYPGWEAKWRARQGF